MYEYSTCLIKIFPPPLFIIGILGFNPERLQYQKEAVTHKSYIVCVLVASYIIDTTDAPVK